MANFFTAKREKKQQVKQLNVTVSRLDQNGCGVAYPNKKPIFIEGTLPGEQVKVKIVEEKNKFARATLIECIGESEARVAPKCQHFHLCGGCNLQHLRYEEQITFKTEKVQQLFSRQDIEVELPWQPAILSQQWHYRRKARIGVQYDKRGQPTVGFRRQESNQLTPVKQCPVLVNDFADIFSALKVLLGKLSGKNAIGHVEVIAANVNIVVIRQLVTMTAADKSHWESFAKQHHVVVYVDNGQDVFPLLAPEKTYYQIEQACNIYFNVTDFIQVNHLVNNAMITQAQHWLALNAEDNVLDLFCGLGNFSLPIAQQVNTVVGVEGVISMVEQARANAKQNAISNCQFYQADLNADWQSHKWAHQQYSKAVIDPARAGAYGALEQLATLSIDTLLYISCDPVSLAKDSKLLLSQGYKITKIAIMDMFSQTKHVETMVMFEK